MRQLEVGHFGVEFSDHFIEFVFAHSIVTSIFTCILVEVEFLIDVARCDKLLDSVDNHLSVDS